jgi:putative chitinase
MSLGIDKLKSKMPPVAYDRLVDSLSRTKSVTSNFRLAHFLSQVAHESGNFTVLYENLRYSSNRLRVIFPKYFPTVQLANEYAMKPERIANRVYANRIGNGNEASGDGYKFRGRGYLQVTGRSNYKLFSDYIGEDCVESPDLVATKYPMDSAIWFFDRNKLWSLCDKDDNASVLAVTKRVNGGTNGLADRLTKFRFFMKYLNS